MRKLFQAFAFFTILIFVGCSNQGEQIPDFELTTLNGETVSTQTTKGKVLVVNVWATWCGSCIKEMPELNRLVDEYKGNPDVIFLGITDESAEMTKKSLKRFPSTYTQVADAEAYTSKLQTRLVKTYPQNLVISRDGIITFEVSDQSRNVFDDLKSAIEAALKS
jgi:thiol-disulfide isomerase/thioredoxin